MLALLTTITSEIHLALPQITAVSVNDFLNSIGVNSAISRREENLENTIKCSRYLGIRWIRSGYESDVPIEDLIELHKRTGICFSYGFLIGRSNISKLLDGARQLANAGALIALEGNNEPNNWGIMYQSEKGGRDLSWLPVAKLQRDLYKAVKNDPVLKNYPVWNISESGKGRFCKSFRIYDLDKNFSSEHKSSVIRYESPYDDNFSPLYFVSVEL